MGYTLHGSYRRKEVRAVSYMVARMQKMKADNLVGIGNHNQRKTENHSNKDIDIERSHLNYDLVEGRTENYKTDIQNFIDENKSTSRAVRKDAVLVNEWIISSDGDFFEDKDDKEIERFFEESKDYFADKFGDKNIRYAQVHLDETTPHMHLGVVPFDKDNKLSAKRVFGRQALRDVQDDLPRFLNERGFAIQRGEKGSERKNLTVPEYKKMKGDLRELEKSKSDLHYELIDTNREIDLKKELVTTLTADKRISLDEKDLGLKYQTKAVEVPTGEKNIFGKDKTKTERRRTGNVVIPHDQYLGMKNYLEDMHSFEIRVKDYLATDPVRENLHFHSQLSKLEEELENTKSENISLKNENRSLNKQVLGLEEKVNSLKDEVKTMYHTIKDTFTRGLKGNVEQVKLFMSDLAEAIEEKLPENEFSRENEREKKQDRVQERKRNGGRSR